MAKVLHIVVRHRSNPNPKFPNQWLDDDRIRSIVTFKEIADLCSPLVASTSVVRIHRTGVGWDGVSYEQPAAICCEATVQAVRRHPAWPLGADFEVEFTHVSPLRLTPTFRPDPKQSWYFAETGDSASPANAAPNEPERPQAERTSGRDTMKKLMADENLYKAEYQGSGTFIISKPKRKAAKLRQTRLKSPKRGARKS
jgi:hypothetical protein